jgi:Uma2 family endonuclease
MATPTIRTRRWTRDEYERLGELGVFGPDEPIELIGGELIVSEPKRSPHETAVGLVEDALRAAFGSGWVVRVGSPIALDDESEPEPDVAVVPGQRRDYRETHPSRSVLVVEVADTSLAFDRDHKGSLYARAGVVDYWIVDLIGGVLEVHRQPVADASARFGWRYGSVDIVRPAATVSPLALPGAGVRVADLLP